MQPRFLKKLPELTMRGAVEGWPRKTLSLLHIPSIAKKQ
jgi:hypothetical protein